MKTFNKFHFFSYIWRLAFVLLFSLSTQACMKSAQANLEDKEKQPEVLETDVLKRIEGKFRANFSRGNWRYTGVDSASGGDFHAYIQIPERLSLSKKDTEHYIRQAICPRTSEEGLWKIVKDYDLTIHLYTDSKYSTISAECENPFS